jgi:hypothetical protein
MSTIRSQVCCSVQQPNFFFDFAYQKSYRHGSSDVALSLWSIGAAIYIIMITNRCRWLIDLTQFALRVM